MRKKQVTERYAVIFDTNAYRNLVTDVDEKSIKAHVYKLRERESLKKIKCFGHIIVGLEMLNHLQDTTDLNFDECYKGVMAMYHHCFDEEAQQPKIIPHSRLLICNLLFGQKPAPSVDNVCNIGGVINDIVVDKKNIEDYRQKTTFEDINNFILEREREFANSIDVSIKDYKQIAKKKIEKDIRIKHASESEYIILKLIKKETTEKKINDKTLQLINNNKFLEKYSIDIVEYIASILRTRINSNECKKKAKILRESVPLSIRFFQWICNYVVENRTDINSRKSQHNKWNWLWDMQVAFCSGSTIDNRSLIIVTDDSDIHVVVKKYGNATQIMNLKEYKEFVGF